MAIYKDERDPNDEMWERQATTNDQRVIIDPINVQALINFLEYEEALTQDPQTANRIRLLLQKIKIWD
jgi:hypothetical protein